MLCVLVLASGAAWESTVLAALAREPDLVVLKRCVDVDDLLAAATAGQAHAAVVSGDAPGLDAAAVDHLRRHRVRLLAVLSGGPAAIDQARMRAQRVGVRDVVAAEALGDLPATLRALGGGESPGPAVDDGPSERRAGEPGRVYAVWGPAGAPGRTTVAVALAAELARRARPTVLVDADPYAGTLAQQLGILDEASGLLSAARLATSGLLAERVSTVARRVGPHLEVVTGLPRPDRWVEVRSGVVEQLVAAVRPHADVVLDTGFCLEEDPGSEYGARPGRNSTTLAAVAAADEVVVVGAADPVGLARLARGLVELRDLLEGAPVRVVVNRNRDTLGWSEREIAGMVSGFARVLDVHFLPEDRAAVDRALLAGTTLLEQGDSPLVAAVAEMVDAVVPPESRGVRRRRAGRARRR